MTFLRLYFFYSRWPVFRKDNFVRYRPQLPSGGNRGRKRVDSGTEAFIDDTIPENLTFLDRVFLRHNNVRQWHHITVNVVYSVFVKYSMHYIVYLCILCLSSSAATITYVKRNEIRYFPRESSSVRVREGIISRDTKVELYGSKVREHPVRSCRKWS